MTAEEFRALALTFPGAVEGSHFDIADFRVGKKIFATLRESDGRAVLKLFPEEQHLLVATGARRFRPDQGFMGLQGLDSGHARAGGQRNRPPRHVLRLENRRTEEARSLTLPPPSP